MGIYSFSEEEFTYLAFNLFAIDFDEPPNWEDYDFEREYFSLFKTLKCEYINQEGYRDKCYNESFDIWYNIHLSKAEIDIIYNEVKVGLRNSITDPKFEEYLELGNSILYTLSRPSLKLKDIKDD